jgi:hypothetical protein
MKDLLDKQHATRLYWWGIILYFALFSFNALATSTLAAFIGAKWGILTGQEKFMIIVAILANWTGLVLVFVQKGMGRIISGKPPIETGDTQRLSKSSLLVALLFACLLCGCASVHQSATTTTTDPKTGIVETREVKASIVATGDAKSAVEKMTGGATSKSAHIGASGVSEESNVTDMIQAIGTTVEKIFNAGVAAGAKTVKP